MNKSFYLAQDQLAGSFEIVNLHASTSALAFSGTNALASQYKVSGYPTGIVDGRLEIGNETDIEVGAAAVAAAVSDTEARYPVVTSVGLSSSLSGRTATISAEVYCMVADAYKLTVLLLENSIVASQASNETGTYINDYVHDNIARVAVSSISGDDFSAAAGETRTFQFTATVPDGCNLANMTVLAYVQRPYGSQEIVRSADYGDYYIDNCRIVPLGETAAPEVSD